MFNNVYNQENDIMKYDKILVDILLKDRTTNKNIIWATDDYFEFGLQYNAEKEILSFLLMRGNIRIIEPRVNKKLHTQSNRTRQKAEVFTPCWICNEQNNLIDAEWFGRENVFNFQLKDSWKVNYNKVIFENAKGKTWKDYVDARRLEIACGEAPYLVSRYDTVTGNAIEVTSRIGLLDRKLRVVNENTDNEQEWIKWVERAYQSIYGYEYQGDNLFLARENLILTFIENLKYKFNRKPTLYELKRIAHIISWNIWQMDGIDYSVPNCEDKSILQLNLFDVFEEEKILRRSKRYCKIKDWRANKTLDFLSLIKRG